MNSIPRDESFWVRRATQRVWQVRHRPAGTLVCIRLPGTEEEELHEPKSFFENFYPEEA